MARHTAGPWSINRDAEYCGVRIDGPSGRSVAHVIQRDPHPALGQGITQEEAEANGLVMAAASELLEEVEALYIWLGDYTHEWPGRSTLQGQARLIRMRDVIAKSTGRSEQDVQDDYGTRAAIAARGAA